MAWGGGWTYVIWGELHAVYQILGDLLIPCGNVINKILNVKTEKLSYRAARVLRTFILVDVAFIFFRAKTFTQAWYIIQNSFFINNFGMIFNGGLYSFGLDQRNMNTLILGIIILVICEVISDYKKKTAIIWIGQQGVVLRYIFYWTVVTMIVISMNTSSAEFLYMQF